MSETIYRRIELGDGHVMYEPASDVAQCALWQPIETAPRDGSRILAMGGGLGDVVEIVSYNETIGAWATPYFTLDDRDDEAEGYNRPTKWQYLPNVSAVTSTYNCPEDK